LGLSREQYNLTIINSTGEVTHSSGHPVAGQSSAADRIVLINGAKSKLRLILFAQEV
jgi:hypothetical protein